MPKVYDKVTILRKPEWLKINLRHTERYAETARIVEHHGLHTICSSGKCPNQAECWERGTATMMILGDICTRACRFCATASGRPLPPEESEPQRIAESVKLMGLRHAVLTSVTRDDLPDGGAEHWRRVVEAVKAINHTTTVEVLIPDFDAKPELIDIVLSAGADIVGHNIETVERLTPSVRSRARYRTSLATLAHIAERGAVAKSGLMVGLGESDEEVLQTLDDLREVGCRIVTIGQYLRPTLAHVPVERYVTPAKFAEYARAAREKGFEYVASGPLVRSSYLAERYFEDRHRCQECSGKQTGSKERQEEENSLKL